MCLSDDYIPLLINSCTSYCLSSSLVDCQMVSVTASAHRIVVSSDDLYTIQSAIKLSSQDGRVKRQY